MGALFSDLFKHNHFEDIEIDFEGAEPSEKDQPLLNRAVDILEGAPDLINEIDNYESRTEYIRKALSEPSQETEDIAFEMVSSNALHSCCMWKAATQLESAIPDIFRALGETDDEKSPAIANQQALSFKLAALFDFILRVDELKMLQPGLQNDFSFYRRALPKHIYDENLIITDEDASYISMFLAQPCPMMSSVCKAISRSCFDDDIVIEQVANMANGCLMLIKARKFKDNSPNYILCLRTMVACIVLYDSVNPAGVFNKGSPVSIKAAANMLVKEFRKDFPEQPDPAPLINIVQYTCPHFNDDSTPQSIKQLF